jgi:hypothetical protein
MKKIRLDLELLDVESFETAKSASEAGTVHAHSFVSDMVQTGCCEPASAYCQPTDYHWDSCGVSCRDACFPTGPDCEG